LINTIDSELPREPSLLCIVKWGGELTPGGRVQAEELGRIFRCMYPGGQGISCIRSLLKSFNTISYQIKIKLHF
jgi:hypothetical protein